MSLLNRWNFVPNRVVALKTIITIRSHVVTLTAGSWESPVNRDPIVGGYVGGVGWGFFLPFHIREKEGLVASEGRRLEQKASY
jgi:hypothetical protein